MASIEYQAFKSRLNSIRKKKKTMRIKYLRLQEEECEIKERLG